MDNTHAEAVISFWFSAAMRQRWFSSTPTLDAEIRDRFDHLWRRASTGELDNWKTHQDWCLALIIVLDQLPLNMFRGQALSFKTEQMAIATAKYAISQNYDRIIPAERLTFLYMPLMHSEQLEDQEISVRLFEAASLKDNIPFARHHRDIIKRFGRFPHRNAILGRESRQEERDYLTAKGAFLG